LDEDLNEAKIDSTLKFVEEKEEDFNIPELEELVINNTLIDF